MWKPGIMLLLERKTQTDRKGGLAKQQKTYFPPNTVHLKHHNDIAQTKSSVGLTALCHH